MLDALRAMVFNPKNFSAKIPRLGAAEPELLTSGGLERLLNNFEVQDITFRNVNFNRGNAVGDECVNLVLRSSVRYDDFNE